MRSGQGGGKERRCPPNAIVFQSMPWRREKQSVKPYVNGEKGSGVFLEHQ